MHRKLIWSSVMALSVLMTSFCSAQIVEEGVVINFEDSGPSLGDALERATSGGFGSLTFPLSAIPLNAEGDVVALGEESLVFTVLSAQGNGDATDFDGSISSFGIHSPGADSGTQALNASNNEQFEFSLDQNVEITGLDLTGLGGSDVFELSFEVDGEVSTLSLVNSDGDVSDVVDISDDPFFIPANTAVLVRPAVGNVGIQDITVNVLEPTTSVPEPSSMLGLMGLAGLLAVKRRR